MHQARTHHIMTKEMYAEMEIQIRVNIIKCKTINIAVEIAAPAAMAYLFNKFTITYASRVSRKTRWEIVCTHTLHS